MFGRILTFLISETADLDEFEKGSLDALNFVVQNESTAIFNLVKNDNNVTTAKYETSELDLADAEAHGNNNDFYSTKALLAHEAVEQLAKSKLVEIIGLDAANKDYDNAHKQAIKSDLKNNTSNLDRSSEGITREVSTVDARGTNRATLSTPGVKQRQKNGEILTGTQKESYKNGNFIPGSQSFTPDETEPPKKP